MGLTDWLAGFLISGAALFFLAAALGLLRFPDLYSRLHAVTKADTVALALLVTGLGLSAVSPSPITSSARATVSALVTACRRE